MEKLAKAMTDLIAGEVCGKAIDAEAFRALSEEELKELYKLSKKHDLAHIVGNALIKSGVLTEGRVKAAFEKEIFTAVYRYEKLNYELGEIRRALGEAKIPFIPLKGAVIRKYYPEPWERTSCDIDVLVKEEDLDRAISALVNALGYTCERREKGSHDMQLYSQSGMHLELHYSLIEDHVIGEADKLLRNVWDYTECIDGTSEIVLTDEMYYYYHIAHMAKHFVYGGCGVRPFLDVWILKHKLLYSESGRNELLKKGGLDTFAKYSELLSEIWFGDETHTETTKELEYFILNGGVYGTLENRVSVQQNKEGGKIKYIFSRIWLPYDVLRFQYPALNKRKFLLPFYEMCRWFKLIFKGRAKRGVSELKVNENKVSEAKKLLSELKL